MTLRGQGGLSLVEMLLTSTMMLVVLAASLGALDVVTREGARAAAMVESVDSGRGAMGLLTRDLRDATSGGGDGVLLRATPADLVLKRIDPFGGAVQTLRWCLDRKTGKLYRQVRDGVAVPGPVCPIRVAGWSVRLAAIDVSNGERPVFTYDAAALAEIGAVDATIAVDATPNRRPREVVLQSGVLLRNQNRRPIASFSHVALPGRNVQLNAQASRDPEGTMLTYLWKEGEETLPYSSSVASYIAPSDGPRMITLVVTDAEGLQATVTQTVQVLP